VASKRIGSTRTFGLGSRTRRCLVSALLGTLVALWSIPGKCETPSGTAAPGKSDPAAVECLEGGNKAADAGNFDEAVKLFTACSEKFPNSVEVHFLLGMAHFYKHDTEKATAELKKAMQLDPNNPNATAMLGRIYSFDAQKLSLAKELLDRVLSAEPYRDDVRFDLARVYARQGKLEETLKNFQVLFSGEPKYALYHTEFAKILVAGGQKDEARKHLQRALVLVPNFEMAKNLLESLDKGDTGDTGTKEAPK
jgi:tetratricopeptide (TPR) repeat protein